MTKTNNTLATIATVTSILIALFTPVGFYYSSKEALKDALAEFKQETAVEIERLKGKDAIHDVQLAQLGDAVKAATTYIGAGIVPEKTK